jgi:hypothetical protein
MNLKAQILNAADVKTSAVEVPEWGCTVHVRTMTGADAASMQKHKDDAFIVCLIACDEHGQRLFEDSDHEALLQKSALAIHRIAKAALVHNGLGGDQEDEPKNS